MSKALIFTESITIKAAPSKVWEALTNPEMTKQFMYGCEVISDWKVGSSVIWKGAADGVTYVTGKLLKYEPHSVLAMTVFDPNAGYEDIPENYLHSEYEFTEDGDSTILKITQGDFATVAKGKERLDGAPAAWEYAFNGLKKLCEG